jgi:hypothetical protein
MHFSRLPFFGLEKASREKAPVPMDALIAAVLFLGAACVGVAYVATWGSYGFFYQREYGVAVMVALGKGYQNPDPGDIPGLKEFIAGTTRRLPMQEIPSAIKTQPLTQLQYRERYLLYTVGTLWRLFGISWDAILPLYGFLYAMTVLAAFGILRLGMNRLWSSLGAVLVLLSPLNVYFLPNLRDYGKAPFILLSIFLLGCLVKRKVKMQSILPLCAALGLLLGVGLGFRKDVIICLPAAFVVIALFLPGKPWEHMKLKLAGVGILLACFSAFGWRILYDMNKYGSATYHVTLLGLLEPFERQAGLGGAPYEIGSNLSDPYAYCMMKSFQQRVAEPSAPDKQYPYGSRDFDMAGGMLYREIVRTFPADWILRWYAAALRIIDYGPFITEAVTAQILHNEFTLRLFNMRWRTFYWMSGRGKYCAIFAILLLSLREVRYAAALFFFLMYFVGYASIQFEPRHFFHLEVASWWVCAFFAQQICSGLLWLGRAANRQKACECLRGSWTLWRKPIARVAGAGVAMLVTLALPLGAAYAYQYSSAAALFKQVAEEPLTPVECSTEQSNGNALFKPTNDNNTVISQKMDTDPWAVATRFMVVELDCPRVMPIWLVYNAAEAQTNFSRCVWLEPRAGQEGQTMRYFFPVYETGSASSWGASTFQGVLFPGGSEDSFRGMYEVKDLQHLRFLPALKLCGRWEDLPRSLSLQSDLVPLYPRGLHAHKHNLIPSGDFETWTEDAVPYGFMPPQGNSTITQETEDVAEGKTSVRQTWMKNDASDSVFGMFHVEIPALAPDTCYELFVTARVLRGTNVRITAYQVSPRPDGTMELRRLSLELIGVTSSAGFREYAGRFVTLPGKDFFVILAANCNGTEFPATAIWDDWRLVPARS